MITTSYPLDDEIPSGIFVKRLAKALDHDDDLLVLTPCSRRWKNRAQYPPPTHCFRYAPRAWQRLAHEPGGIPVALKDNPLLWLFVPIFLLAMFLSTLRHGRNMHVIHANWAATGLVGGLAGKLLRKPVITTLRGSDVGRLKHSRLQRGILRLVLHLNASVVTVSTPMHRMLLELFPRHAQRCFHIPNGVDEQLLAIPLPTLTPGTLRLVSIGNLIPLKGNASIIEALQSLRDSVTLEIVGDGAEREFLEKLACKLGLTDRVRFRGSIPPDHIPDILGKRDALILASHSEGRPNVVVEAMAAGRAVLASRLPGVEELIEDGRNGLLFNPGDPAAIAHAIEQLLTHPEKVTTFGQAARRTVLDLGLSWPACARQYRHIYDQALHGDA